MFLSCANYGFCHLNLAGITKFKYEKKNEKDSGRSSKMTPSCKWPIRVHVASNLCFKARLSAKTLIWKWFLIMMQIKLIFTWKVSQLASFWKRVFLELGNGLLLFHWTNFEKYMIFYTLPWSRWNRTHKLSNTYVVPFAIVELGQKCLEAAPTVKDGPFIKQLHHCTQRFNHKDISKHLWP